ncbi:AAA family ATPase [Lapillicoccus sp.]|uniref:AAA family ATPase n=1 Tax=Lapillicoccus sp. TaxID=1909287 RepID=UPI0032658806
MSNPLLDALTRAVDAAPDDVTLRLHLAELLMTDGQQDAAVSHCAVALQHDPSNAEARVLMSRAMGVPSAQPAPAEGDVPTHTGKGFDWGQAESDISDVAPEPMFVDEGAASDPSASAWDVESSTVTLADVGGMTQVKERLNAAFLAPMRNPELRKLYGKSLRGGMLLYGPPGCGKTFIGRAVAGEMGAHFVNVGLADVLDMYVGTSERNIQDVFRLARDNAPCVLFLDEVDALGQKRSMTRNSGMRTAVNQLLTELDGAVTSNEGVFVIAATNQPWDVDPAMRRPGRLDRTLLVLPPDAEARESIFRHHLRHRPVEGIDLRRLARATEGYSGADIAHVCETASEHALLDGVRTGKARMIGMGDLEAALQEVRPSTGPWFDSARNVVQFANEDGTYNELREWMRKHRKL